MYLFKKQKSKVHSVTEAQGRLDMSHLQDLSSADNTVYLILPTGVVLLFCPTWEIFNGNDLHMKVG